MICVLRFETPLRAPPFRQAARVTSTAGRKPKSIARVGPQHRSRYSNGLAGGVLPAAPAFGSKRLSPGNPDDLAVSALSTRVSASDRGRTQLDVLDSGNGAGPDAHSDREGR